MPQGTRRGPQRWIWCVRFARGFPRPRALAPNSTWCRGLGAATAPSLFRSVPAGIECPVMGNEISRPPMRGEACSRSPRHLVGEVLPTCRELDSCRCNARPARPCVHLGFPHEIIASIIAPRRSELPLPRLQGGSRRGREAAGGFAAFNPPYENPIQRPPHATPNQRTNDMIAVDRATNGRSAAGSNCTTRRRIVNVKSSTRRSDVIFTQKAKL